jgi:aminoglycoside phosphotransferase (APT) family kinase protein
VARQIKGWSDRYEKALTPDAPQWEAVKAWLNDKMPADHPTSSIVHNDYRFDNVILDPNNPMQIIGVLDWELTTLGDPLMDLGNTLAYWIEAGDPAPVQLMRRQPSHAPGMLTRREFVDYYAERSGIRIDNFDFYYTYGLFRLAGIVQQIYYRFYHGQTQDKRFAQFIHMNKLLEQMSLQVMQPDTRCRSELRNELTEHPRPITRQAHVQDPVVRPRRQDRLRLRRQPWHR